MNIGERILKIRKSKKITQENLAEAIGVTRQTISNWELGDTSPNYEQLILISKAFNIDIGKLTSYEKEFKKSNNIIKVIPIIIIIGILFIYLFANNKNNSNASFNNTNPVGVLNNEENSFIKTFRIDNIIKNECSNELSFCEYKSIILNVYEIDGESVTIEIPNADVLSKLEIGKIYEFEFISMGAFYDEEDIYSIFKFCAIKSINETTEI